MTARPATAAPTDELAWRLERLADAGDVQPARLRKQDCSWRPTGAGLAAGTARDVLDAVREERGA